MIDRLVGALRPGGVLMLEDLYFGGAPTAVMEPATRPAELGPTVTRCCDAFEAGLRAAGADMHFGAGLLTQEDMDRTLAATVDPSVSWFTLGLVSAWGRRRYRVRPGQSTAVSTSEEGENLRSASAPSARW